MLNPGTQITVIGRRRRPVIIAVILAIIGYFLIKKYNPVRLFTKNLTTINVNPFNTEEMPPEQTGMQERNKKMANSINDNFPWNKTENMNDTINKGIKGSLLIPNRSILGTMHIKDLPRDRTIISGRITGEQIEGVVAKNNIYNSGTGSVVPLGIDSSYANFQNQYNGRM